MISICPFMPDEDMLVVFPCEGVGQPLPGQGAGTIAPALLQRQSAEKEEERKVRQVMRLVSRPAGAFVVADRGGARVIDG
jgi:hypothetical protein